MTDISVKYIRKILNRIVGHSDQELLDAGGHIETVSQNPNTYHDITVTIILPKNVKIQNNRGLNEFNCSNLILENSTENYTKVTANTEKGKIGIISKFKQRKSEK